MLSSFRLKITILSASLAGAILVIFGVVFTALIWKTQRERIDHELYTLADSQLRLPKPPPHWRYFNDSMQTFYGATGKQLLLKVSDRSGQILFLSSNWPPALSAQPPPVVASNTVVPPLSADPLPSYRRHPRLAPFWQPFAFSLWAYGMVWLPEPRPFHPYHTPGPPKYATLSAGAERWRFIMMSNSEIGLALGMCLASTDREGRRLQLAFFLAACGALLALSLGGWALAHAALRPVQLITHTAAAITVRDLNRRIPAVATDSEFKHLIAVINNMLERLANSYQQAVRFSADAAHELKTPLTLLQGQLEQALQDAPENSREQRLCGDLLAEVHRLKEIVRKLLLLAQADAGRMCLTAQPVDLSALINAIVDDLQAIAPNFEVESQIEPGIKIRGDHDLLNQAVMNLAENALKFNDERHQIHMYLRKNDNAVVFTIANTGPGIAPADQPHLFERFYRADKSHSRRIDGTGLGLSLTREIVRAHGGELALSRSDSALTVFTATLPLDGLNNAQSSFA